jgi:hypothetical protein
VGVWVVGVADKLTVGVIVGVTVGVGVVLGHNPVLTISRGPL